MSSPADAVDELGRAAALGHVGTMVYGRSGDVTLDSDEDRRLFSTDNAVRFFQLDLDR